MRRPLLLDLYCGAGGAALGYHLAGFHVVGVDSKPQPRYPFRFVLGDALEYAMRYGAGYHAVHGSPPCKAYSEATPNDIKGTHPDLIGPTREVMQLCGRPYVIENVPGAKRLLHRPVVLCGAQFGLKVYRHRLFECSFYVSQPRHTPHDDNCHGNNTISRRGFVNVFGGGGLTDYKRAAMGIGWMTRDELSQAIPPAYTFHVGRHLMRHLRQAGAL